jgi:hypothetical protein
MWVLNKANPMKKPSIARGANGICLAEFLIAATAGAVVLSAALQALDHFQGRLWNQIETIDRQQELRIGLKILADELRLAGTGAPPSSPALLTTEPQETKFLANLDGLMTTLTEPVLAEAAAVIVKDGDNWPKGKRLLVCEYRRCRESRLSRAGQGSTLSLTEPLGQPFAAGHPVVISNIVRYYLGVNRNGEPTMMREVDGGANPLISNVTTFRLLYVDVDGHPTTDASRAARVRIELAVSGGRLVTTEVRVGGQT